MPTRTPPPCPEPRTRPFRDIQNPPSLCLTPCEGGSPCPWWSALPSVSLSTRVHRDPSVQTSFSLLDLALPSSVMAPGRDGEDNLEIDSGITISNNSKWVPNVSQEVCSQH